MFCPLYWFRRELDQEPHILPCFSFSGIVLLSAFFRRQESRLKSANNIYCGVITNLNIFHSFLFQHGSELSGCLFNMCGLNVWWEVNCFYLQMLWTTSSLDQSFWFWCLWLPLPLKMLFFLTSCSINKLIL